MGINSVGAASNSANRIMQTTENGNKYWMADESNNSLGIDDFLTLMVAQLSNQDFNNPTDNTQFIAQMAQFTALQLQKEMLFATNSNFAASLVGKNVIMAELNEKGELVKTEGVVEKVLMTSSGCQIVVGGKTFTLENLMEIVNEDTDAKDQEKAEMLAQLISDKMSSSLSDALASIMPKVGKEDGKDEEDNTNIIEPSIIL